MNPSSRPDPALPSLPFPERPAPKNDRCNNGIKVPPSGNYWDFCPNCSARLIERKCKRICPRCYYYMSCSDFD